MKKNGLAKTNGIGLGNGRSANEGLSLSANPLDKFRQGLPLTEEESWKVDEYLTANVSYLAGMFVPREG